MPNDDQAQPQVHRAQERYRLPAGSRQILLARHGATTGETVHTLEYGDLTISNPPLTAEGHDQAAALAAYLAGEPLAGIFVTPLQRTRQTAAPLVAATGLEPVEIADMREVHLGDWEHSFRRHAETGHPLLQRMMVEESWNVLPNAEPSEDFAARVRRGILAIAEAMAPDTTVIAFSHAATIAEICRQATGSRPFAFVAPENTSVSRLVVGADGRWKLRSFNDMAHLGYL